jgi:hypothetical protein
LGCDEFKLLFPKNDASDAAITECKNPTSQISEKIVDPCQSGHAAAKDECIPEQKESCELGASFANESCLEHVQSVGFGCFAFMDFGFPAGSDACEEAEHEIQIQMVMDFAYVGYKKAQTCLEKTSWITELAIEKCTT